MMAAEGMVKKARTCELLVTDELPSRGVDMLGEEVTDSKAQSMGY